MPELLLRDLPTEIVALRDLVLDLRWSWSHGSDALWQLIDPEAWKRTRNPLLILRDLSLDRLKALGADPSFVREVRRLAEARRRHVEAPGWFQLEHPPAALGGTAYFSMEFGVTEALPLYAGGLGVLAGDLLKTASDLAVPVIGVGLLYQEGYFRQMIDSDGNQQEAYPSNDPTNLPVQPVFAEDGSWLRIPLEFPGRRLMVRVWQATIGRARLYLLDTNDALNSPLDRGITAKLYGGSSEMRLMQELVLGCAGWKTIEAVAPWIEVCHVNEGHPAFAIVERALQHMVRHNVNFAEALWATRAGNVFTTHTPVAAGFDRFESGLIAKYVDAVNSLPHEHPIDLRTLLELGRAHPENPAEPFNMACLAMRGSIASYGVSRLHGEVSRQLFQPLYPRWPGGEIPVEHVTNGVHVPSWDSKPADKLWTKAAGKERWREESGELQAQIEAIPDESLWELRATLRHGLVDEVRTRLRRQLTRRGLSGDVLAAADLVLDPNILTLGFARRFTEYKRPNLLLHDPARLARLLNHSTRPAQLVIAGKAHPDDAAGKQMIRDWICLAAQPEFRPRIVFLEDYDISLAQDLVQGVDVWINTPRRPWEACGTSGMKVLVNGGLNLSVLDGWWAEAYAPDRGWSFGSLGDDAADAEALYALLEEAVVPEFYERDATGIPRIWLNRIRHSLAGLTPAFSSNRMLREYLERAYLPAAAELRRRQAQDGAVARALADWEVRLRRAWPTLHLGRPSMTETEGRRFWSIPVYLGSLDPGDVRVELYADPDGAGTADIVGLNRGEPIFGTVNGFIYRGETGTARPAEDHTVRVVPEAPGVRVPTELALIAWAG